MKQGLRCQRILILLLLSVSVFAPIFLVSIRLSNFNSSLVHEEIIDDLSGIKYKTDTVQKLNSIQQETGEGLKEQPTLVVYKDEDLNSIVRRSNTGGRTSLLQKNGNDYDVKEDKQQIIEEQKIVLSPPVEKNQGRPNQNTVKQEADGLQQNQGRPNQNTVKKEADGLQQNQGRPNQNTVKKEANGLQPRRVTDEKVKEMKDQVIRAKAYLNFAPPGSNSHFVKELRLRIKEVERALGEATKDSDLSRSALQRMRTMEASLSKAALIYNDCSAMATKLRAMTYNTEELVRTQKNQATYLIQLALRTTPKGLHCLSMRLTDDYFALQPDERKLPNQQKLQEPDLYHFAVFSDNILSCAVVVNSTISSAMEEEKIVFHVVTDTINLPAITMWFLLNPPGQATIQIQSVEDFEWIPSKYGSVFKMQDSRDPRYTSALNHLRFYLPEVFPALNKIVLLDHDVVVQRDLRGLWEIDMKGKVNGAVETCREGDISFRGMDALINFTDPIIAEKFDAKACTWAFGMNVFDLQEWRRRNLTTVYSKYLELGKQRQLWTGGSLPLGQVTFYNLTVALDRRWHVLGLGYESGLAKGEIERAAVIHYDGNMKPWLEIGIGKYKGYWTKYVKYDHPFLQQCNIHE